MSISRRALAAWSLAAASIVRNAAAQGDAAAEFPNRPIRMVVPYPPAGGNDLLARAVKAPLETRWHQPIVVENRPGANGTIASEAVAKGSADGYTLLMGSTATHAINPSLYRRIGYNAQRDFAPVALVGSTPLILTVHPSVPARTLAELIALGKAQPGALSFASVGNGSVGHLAGQMFQTAAGIELLHVPYRGIAQASTEMLSGLVKMGFSNVVNVLPFIREGQLRPLAVTTAVRSPVLPDVPTVAETLPGFDVPLWWGVFAPSRTPTAIVAKLNAAMRQVLQDPELQARWAGEAITLTPGTPDDFARLLATDIPRWAEAVHSSGAEVE
jgi:tripartite-type tricarboxylate transporter receptor subunit TctC